MFELPPEHVIAQALAHPLRARALAILGQLTASPKELARELGCPLTDISYHVRALAEFGVIRLERTTPRRGAVEHHYRATVRLGWSPSRWSPQESRGSRILDGDP